MPIGVACPCGKWFRVPDDCVGRRARCPACGQAQVVSAAAVPRASTPTQGPAEAKLAASVGRPSLPMPPPDREPFIQRLAGRLLALPKPILFGLCGAVGGLLAALLLGELLWALLSPAVVRDPRPGVQMAVPDSMRLFVGGKNDLHVKVARDRFEGPITIEADDEAPAGFSVSPVTIPPEADEARVEVRADERFVPGEYQLPLRARGPDRSGVSSGFGTVEISVERPPPGLRLAVSPQLAIYQGGKNRLLARVVRDGFEGPVALDAIQAPEGVTVAAVTIPAGKDEAEIEVAAERSVPAAKHWLSLRGRGPDGKRLRAAFSGVELNVQHVPTHLRISVPPQVTLYRGGKGRFTIRVGRTNFEGSVNLSFTGVPAGVTLPSVTVPADRDEAQVEVTAREDHKGGTWPIRVEAVSSASGQRLSQTAGFQMEVLSTLAPQADILFVLDLTGSMQFAIEGIKDGIQKFATELEEKNIDARIGLIGFRDIADDKERPFPLEIQGATFTTDYQAFRNEVRRLRAAGGGDGPESCLQALALAAQQPFRPNASRVLLLITDAPPKIHPSETPSTVKQTIEELTGKQVQQLHLVVRKGYYDLTYKQLHEDFKGKFFDLANANDRDGFVKMLPELGAEISRITRASAPALAKVETPPLPAGTAAALPPAARPALPPAQAAEPAPPPQAPVLKAVQSTQAYSAEDRYRLLLAIAVWTMVIAGGISLLILAGQHFYTRQAWMPLSDGSRALGGGVLAGLIGGAVGQLFFQATTGGSAWEVISRVLGWSLLGGLIGGGMAFFVPNLKWWRGLLGGVLGGFVGALFFLVVGLLLGSLPGRWVGAAVLGFCIGLMVALAELAFRRWWLEIAFGPREVRTVTLGAAAVSIGGDERRATVFVPGSPPITLRYHVTGDRVLCDDVRAEKTVEVQPGDRRTLGRVTVTLCSAAQVQQSGYSLRLSNGASYLLGDGLPLTVEDLPGLQPQGADGVVALVSRRPNDPGALVLRNRSKQTWTARGADGAVQAIEPGRSVELGHEMQIAFGELCGTLRHDAHAGG